MPSQNTQDERQLHYLSQLAAGVPPQSQEPDKLDVLLNADGGSWMNRFDRGFEQEEIFAAGNVRLLPIHCLPVPAARNNHGKICFLFDFSRCLFRSSLPEISS